MRLPRTTLAGATAVAALAIPAPALGAEAFYGVTSDNQLVTFQSDAPSQVQRSVPLTGLAPEEQAIAIDIRPATGQLYVLGGTSRVYVVSPLTGAARPLGDNPFSPPLAGTSFGFDFNPVSDRIRVVSDGRQNLRLTPDDGQVAAQDGQLAYAEGDPGANGVPPQVSSSGYTNNVPGARETQLFGIDPIRHVLVLQDPPNSGTLKTVGPLNADVFGPFGFDVAADGRAFVAGRRPGGGPSELFTIDLVTGALTLTARRSALGARELRGLTAAGPVPDDDRAPSLLIAPDRTQEKSRLRRTLTVPVSCSEFCLLKAQLLRGSRSLGTSTGRLIDAGRSSLKIRSSSSRRRLARRRGSVSLTLRVEATDAAGNVTRTRRSIRFR